MLVVGCVAAGGCGSSAAHSSSVAVQTTTTSATFTASAGTIPPGFARYSGKDFTFLAPAGFRRAANGGIGGLPRGATAQILTRGGRRVERTNTQIIEGFNPRLRTDVDLDQVATSLETADRSNPSQRNVHTTVSTMTVSGAQQVRLVSESYVGPVGDGTRTLFHRTWLMVLPRPGLLVDVVVVEEPRRGGTLDPAAVLDSFRLDRPGG
jgi:hypothetical protein